jgi:transposase InsO family protein
MIEMPWKKQGEREERFRFIEDYRSEDWSLADLCREYGVARATGYKWLERYEQGGLDGLKDLSRAPHSHPNVLSAEVEQQIIAIRDRHPTWGAGKIRAKLEGQEKLPAESTVGMVLKRHGLTVARKKRPQFRPSSEPLAHADGPNRVWCIDYKGHFRTANGERVDPLTVTDAYSRYLFRCVGLPTPSYALTKPVLQAAFREFGLPDRVRTDNGTPFGSNGESGLTALSVWWIKLGIVHERIQPGQPQQNGRHERMHRTLKRETASPPASTPRTQQSRFDHFRHEYNEERPHESLGQKPPAQFYRHSPRPYPGRLPAIEYPRGWRAQTVSPGGQIHWGHQYVFVSHALQNEKIGLEPIDDRYWRVWFSFYEIGVLDSHKLTIRRPIKPKDSPPAK